MKQVELNVIPGSGQLEQAKHHFHQSKWADFTFELLLLWQFDPLNSDFRLAEQLFQNVTASLLH